MNQKVMVAITLCALAGTAFAETASKDAYAEIDVDSDDSLSIEEAGAVEGLAEQWDGLDIDGDGKLNREEFSRADITAQVSMPR